jgi:hypothetical protein
VLAALRVGLHGIVYIDSAPQTKARLPVKESASPVWALF